MSFNAKQTFGEIQTFVGGHASNAQGSQTQIHGRATFGGNPIKYIMFLKDWICLKLVNSLMYCKDYLLSNAPSTTNNKFSLFKDKIFFIGLPPGEIKFSRAAV